MDKQVKRKMKIKVPKKVTLLDLLNCLVGVGIYIILFYVALKYLPKLILFFMPLILGLIISIISNRLVTRLEEKFNIPRNRTSIVIVVLVTMVFVGFFIFVGYGIYSQISGSLSSVRSIIYEINKTIKIAEETINNLLVNTPISTNVREISIPKITTDNAIKLINEISMPFVNYFVDFVKNIPSFIVNIVFTILSAYVLIIDNKTVRKKLKSVFSKKVYDFFKYLQKEVILIFNGWLKAQIIVVGLVFLVLLAGMLIMQVKFPVLFALLIALVDALPIFGSGLFLWPWLVYTLIQRNFFDALVITSMYIAIQIIRNVIQNKIMSSDFGLNALGSIFILFIGFKLYGFVGLIFAIPIGVLIMSLYNFGLFNSLIYLLQKLFLCIKVFLTQIL